MPDQSVLGNGVSRVLEAKRIILVCDGTWNNATAVDSEEPTWTNPQRLANCLAMYNTDGKAQVIIYLSGVGTTTSSSLNWRQAKSGDSTAESIFLGYYQLCMNWESGADEIFLIGFSRGGYVAKAIARIVCEFGIAKYKFGFESIVKAWKGWNKARSTKTPDVEDFSKSLEEGTTHELYGIFTGVSIQACFVWDMVGSLDKSARRKIEFLTDDNIMDCRGIKYAYHALALNECRKHFLPMIWSTKGKDGASKGAEPTEMKQCWFLGHHSDIGGASCVGAANISLNWMLGKIVQHNLLALQANRIRGYLNEEVLSSSRKIDLVDPTREASYYMRYLWWWAGYASRRPMEVPLSSKTNESIHWSVWALMNQGSLPRGLNNPLEEKDIYDHQYQDNVMIVVPKDIRPDDKVTVWKRHVWTWKNAREQNEELPTFWELNKLSSVVSVKRPNGPPPPDALSYSAPATKTDQDLLVPMRRTTDLSKLDMPFLAWQAVNIEFRTGE